MILLHLSSSNKIIQDISSFLLKEPNFKVLLCQSTLFQFKFGINSLTIYAEYFTHVVLKYYSDVYYKIYLMVCFVIYCKCSLRTEHQLQLIPIMQMVTGTLMQLMLFGQIYLVNTDTNELILSIELQLIKIPQQVIHLLQT